MNAQLCDILKTSEYFKWVNFMVWELYLIKAGLFVFKGEDKKSCIPHPASHLRLTFVCRAL